MDDHHHLFHTLENAEEQKQESAKGEKKRETNFGIVYCLFTHLEKPNQRHLKDKKVKLRWAAQKFIMGHMWPESYKFAMDAFQHPEDVVI